MITLKEDRYTEKRPKSWKEITTTNKLRVSSLHQEIRKKQGMRERYLTINMYQHSNIQIYKKINFCDYKPPNCNPMPCATRSLNSHYVQLRGEGGHTTNLETTDLLFFTMFIGALKFFLHKAFTFPGKIILGIID